jgi:hypothetical protein
VIFFFFFVCKYHPLIHFQNLASEQEANASITSDTTSTTTAQNDSATNGASTDNKSNNNNKSSNNTSLGKRPGDQHAAQTASKAARSTMAQKGY